MRILLRTHASEHGSTFVIHSPTHHTYSHTDTHMSCGTRMFFLAAAATASAAASASARPCLHAHEFECACMCACVYDVCTQCHSQHIRTLSDAILFKAVQSQRLSAGHDGHAGASRCSIAKDGEQTPQQHHQAPRRKRLREAGHTLRSDARQRSRYSCSGSRADGQCCFGRQSIGRPHTFVPSSRAAQLKRRLRRTQQQVFPAMTATIGEGFFNSANTPRQKKKQRQRRRLKKKQRRLRRSSVMM